MFLELALLQATHFQRDVEGWKVNVDRRLFASANLPLGARSLRLLANQLLTIADQLPANRLRDLRKVPICLDLDNKDLERPQYHPSVEWLRENGFSADMARSVHIPRAAYFAPAGFQSAQPYAVLHELAHAYHDRVLGFENPEIKLAWQKFAADKRHEASCATAAGWKSTTAP